MHYNVNVAVRYTSVLFGKGDGDSNLHDLDATDKEISSGTTLL